MRPYATQRVRPSYMKIMQLALLNSKTGISKVTEPNIFYPSSSLPMSCRKLERSTSFRSGLVKTQPTSSPNHCLLHIQEVHATRLARVDSRTFSDVQIRGSNVCCTLYPFSGFPFYHIGFWVFRERF